MAFLRPRPVPVADGKSYINLDGIRKQLPMQAKRHAAQLKRLGLENVSWDDPLPEDEPARREALTRLGEARAMPIPPRLDPRRHLGDESISESDRAEAEAYFAGRTKSNHALKAEENSLPTSEARNR